MEAVVVGQVRPQPRYPPRKHRRRQLTARGCWRHMRPLHQDPKKTPVLAPLFQLRFGLHASGIICGQEHGQHPVDFRGVKRCTPPAR